MPWALGVHRGPPEVYRGPCMKNMCLKSPITYTYAPKVITCERFSASVLDFWDGYYEGMIKTVRDAATKNYFVLLHYD